jgi:hypothetical protein
VKLCAIAAVDGEVLVGGTPGDIHRRATNGTWTARSLRALHATTTDVGGRAYGAIDRGERRWTRYFLFAASAASFSSSCASLIASLALAA